MFQKEKTIAVLTATSSANEEKEAVTGICEKAKELGWNVLIFNGQYNFVNKNTPTLDTNVYELLDFNLISGVLITQNLMVKTEISSKLIKRCRSHNVPVLSVGFKTDEIDCFTYKNADCMEQIVCHLIEKHNCKVFNFIAGIPNNAFSDNRINAFKKVLKSHNIKFDEKRLSYGYFWEGPVFDAINQFFLSGLELPDAFVCANDIMAMAVIEALNQRGINVPEDVLVTGYDGIEFEQYCTPRLTTAKCDYRILGTKCAESIIKKICGENIPKLQSIEPQVVFSESCGCKNINNQNKKSFALTALSQIGSLRYITTQMHKLATMTSIAKSFSDIKSTIFKNGFHNPNCWILLNENYENLANLSKHTKKKPFSDTMDCFYTSHKYELEKHKSIPRSQLIPDLDKIIDEGITNLFIMDLFFGDESLGYMVGCFDETIVPLTNLERFSQGLSQALSSIKHRVQLERLTVHDMLTGIFNRRGFYDEIKNKSLKASRGNKKYLIIHSIDMDELKYINDSFGHSEGDLSIKTLAKIISEAGGKDSINARFGGDEFVSAIFTGEKPEKAIKEFKEKLGEKINKANETLKKPYKISASIGSKYTSFTKQTEIDSLIKMADKLMYTDKSSKKRSHPRG